MIKFRDLTIEDKTWVDRLMAVDQFYGAEYCFSNLYNWRGAHNTEIGQWENFGIMRSGFRSFSYNYFGLGDRKKLVEMLISDSQKLGMKFKLQGILETEKQRLEELFPDRFHFEEDRASFDYCYTQEKLALLKGRKLSKKRNHISKFLSLDCDWAYEPITRDNLWECHAMSVQWYANKGCQPGSDLDKERESLNLAFDHYWEEKLIGGLLRVNGKVEAFTIGCAINKDTAVVHYEKAFLNYPGCYTMINQQFAERTCSNFSRINREDDTGDEDLRQAKMSYQPDELLKKYCVTLKEPE